MLLLQLQFVHQLELLGSAKKCNASRISCSCTSGSCKTRRVEPHEVDEVILGHCIQRTDEANTARTAALAAGFPDTVTGYTIQRQCSSGMQAIMSAAMQIQLGVSDVVIAGGVEAMSSSPYALKQHRWGQRLQHGEIRDTVWEVLEDPIHHIMMGKQRKI